MISDYHSKKIKKEKLKLSKKCKEQRDLIIEMIDFMDKNGVKHGFTIPKEDCEAESTEYVFDSNGVVKKKKFNLKKFKEECLSNK